MGYTTGLTFWAALIKGCSLLAPDDQQARFFGLLEGGRGLFEALLATIAVAWFAYAVSTLDAADEAAMVQVINFYSIVCLLIGALLWFVLDETSETGIEQAGSSDETVAVTLKETAHDLFSLLLNLRVWLVALYSHRLSGVLGPTPTRISPNAVWSGCCGSRCLDHGAAVDAPHWRCARGLYRRSIPPRAITRYRDFTRGILADRTFGLAG